MKRQSKMTEEKTRKVEFSRRKFVKDASLTGATIGSTALMAGAPTKTASAQGTPTTVTLEVLDPSGAYQVDYLFAHRVPDLSGKTLCEISNNIWQSWRTFPLTRELLQRQYPTIKIIPWDDKRLVDWEKKPEVLKTLGCQAAIVGNAG